MSKGLAASVHARLLARAKERGEDFNLILTRYAIERFLYRLSVSPARDHYWLKGALLFDLWALAREGSLKVGLLADAIAATFARRQTPLPATLPIGLSDEFAQDATKHAQWRAFIGKNRLDAPALEGVVAEVREFVAEPMRLARERRLKP